MNKSNVNPSAKYLAKLSTLPEGASVYPQTSGSVATLAGTAVLYEAVARAYPGFQYKASSLNEPWIVTQQSAPKGIIKTIKSSAGFSVLWERVAPVDVAELITKADIDAARVKFPMGPDAFDEELRSEEWGGKAEE